MSTQNTERDEVPEEWEKNPWVPKPRSSRASDPLWRPRGLVTLTGGPVRVDEIYRDHANAERDALRDLAAHVEDGDPLNQEDRWHVAAVLRHAANHMSMHAPRKRGHQKELYDSMVALEIAELRAKGMTRAAAIERVAEKGGVSLKAVHDALKKQSDLEKWWFDDRMAKGLKRSK